MQRKKGEEVRIMTRSTAEEWNMYEYSSSHTLESGSLCSGHFVMTKLQAAFDE